MKQSHVIIGLIIICAGLFIGLLYVNSERNDLKSDLSALKESINIVVEDRINERERRISDSLRAQHNRFDYKLIDSLINKQNEKTIDSLRNLDDNGRKEYLRAIRERFNLR